MIEKAIKGYVLAAAIGVAVSLAITSPFAALVWGATVQRADFDTLIRNGHVVKPLLA